ncbi:MAG TPA: GEVED domain-containing protein [Hymenobacter sp.]|jgi:PKD repeat protein|uniref:GEVED domain-containing protein n=1 Tax=Hymenobacter sp. TaxID=1898978 RepID=UPI002ED87892
MGIYRVQLANLDTTTNGSTDGYRDYSCRRGANMLQGSTYTLRVQTGTSAAENAVAWIDYNNDGTFAPSERVMYSLNAQAHTASFTVPATATLNQPLRLRIAADYANASVPTACSTPQYSQTEDYQVRIVAGNAPPVSRFATADTMTCSGVVAFQDASLNSPTTWLWQFGDGGTSTQQHPTHTYATAGTYAVQLRACNASGCDSLTRTAYVRVRTDGPRTSTCRPATTAYCCQYGITRVRLAGLDHASADGQAGYEDFSCAARATLTADQPNLLQLTTGPSPHDVRVYLDLNDDGQFSSTSELLYQGLAVQSPTVPFTIASTLAPIYHRALRLRIVADVAGSTGTSPCTAVQSGQVEDYSVTLLPNAARPTASFALQYQQLCGPVRVNLTNTTTGGATAYAWDFGDGSTASQPNPPSHTYATPGVHEVRLVAQNAFGRDTARQQVAVAAACPSYCVAGGTGGSGNSPLYFTRLQLAELDNRDFRGAGVGYRDFTNQYATLQAGQSYPLRTETPPYPFSGSAPPTAVSVWIDYNQDGVFSQSERAGPVAQFSPQLVSLRVPAGAKAGATRLRAIIHQPSQYVYPAACTPSFLNGAVEDYTVVITPPPVAPQPGFHADLPLACNGLVQFRDTSWFAPTAWQWAFGDGGNSPQQHPLHRYAASGTYTVSLQASNAYGTRTLARTGYVRVSALAAGPRPAQCLPSPLAGRTAGQHGIDTLRIGPAFRYHQPHNSPGYRDETCTQAPLNLVRGVGYPVRFVDSNPAGAGFFAWLDANDNGVFEAPGELVFNSLEAGQGQNAIVGTLAVPATAVTGQPLRLRVVQWAGDPYNRLLSPPGPCEREESLGQVRDFTVVLTTALAAGTASRSPSPWSVAPNPSKGLLTVQGAFRGPTPMELRDVLGRVVYRATVTPATSGALSLDLQGLPRGLYLLRVSHHPAAVRVLLE